MTYFYQTKNLEDFKSFFNILMAVNPDFTEDYACNRYLKGDYIAIDDNDNHIGWYAVEYFQTNKTDCKDITKEEMLNKALLIII